MLSACCHVFLCETKTPAVLRQAPGGGAAWIVDLDFDYQQQRIYWIERRPSRILRVHISGRDTVQVSETTTMRTNDRE